MACAGTWSVTGTPASPADSGQRCASFLKIKQNMSTAYHPQTDGQTERMNRTLEDMLRCYIDQRLTHGMTCLPLQSLHTTTLSRRASGIPHSILNHGQHPLTPLSQVVEGAKVPSAEHFTTTFSTSIGEAKKALLAAQSRQRALKKRRHVEYAKGDEVWLSSRNISVQGPGTRKLMPRWLGPFKVIELCGPVAYKLELPATMSRLHPVFHVSLLQKYVPPAGGRRKRSPDPIVLDDGELEWEVEAVLYHRQRKHKRRGKISHDYFVKWKGYGMEEASWEPEQNLDNCKELLQEYWASHSDDAPVPERAPMLDERSRGYTVARETAHVEPAEAQATVGTGGTSRRGRKRKRREAGTLRRSKRLHPV